MKFTTPHNLPYPDATDDYGPLEQWFKDLATAVQAALSADSGWIDATYQNGWSSGTGSDSAKAQYRKIGNRVYLTGDVVKSGTLTARTTVFTLPAGFRPKSILIQPCAVAGWTADVQISSNGQVGISATLGRSSNTGYPLTGISFLVD